MVIGHIWACSCGAQTPCRPEDMRLGAVWKCPQCEQVWGCVYPSRGGKAWVKISDDDVAFHDLLAKDDDEVDLQDVFGYGPSAPGWREPKRR